MADRLFTPASARNALQQVRPIAQRMCCIVGELEARRPARIGTDQRVEPSYFSRVRALHRALDTLAGLGVQVKDLKQGLIDFPAQRDGRAVLLCWKVDESSLEWWHELEDGLAGRRPVDDDGPWDDGGSRTPEIG